MENNVLKAAEQAYYGLEELGALYRYILDYPLPNSARMLLQSMSKRLRAACGLLYSAAERLGMSEFYPERFGNEKYRYPNARQVLRLAETKLSGIIRELAQLSARPEAAPAAKELLTVAAMLSRQLGDLGYLISAVR